MGCQLRVRDTYLEEYCASLSERSTTSLRANIQPVDCYGANLQYLHRFLQTLRNIFGALSATHGFSSRSTLRLERTLFRCPEESNRVGRRSQQFMSRERTNLLSGQHRLVRLL